MNYMQVSRAWLHRTTGNFLKILAIFSLAAAASLANAADPVSAKKGLAIGGHDSVAYHSLSRAPQDKAAKGEKTFIVEHLGVKWRFGSQESADLFAADPDKYQPAYNGHCANALSLGKGLLKTNGKVWEIIDDQLYLFYAKKGRKRWLKAEDVNEYIAAADAAWASIIKE